MTKLRDICRFQSGGTPSRGTPAYFNGNVPWITTVALNGDVIDGNQAIEWITDEAIAKSAAKIVPPHSVMVGTRVGIGKVAINSVPMSTSQDIISLIGIDENKWDKKFICHLITANKEHLTSQARGATIKGIKIEAIADLVLPEISLKEQARISEVIGKVDALMHMHQQMAMNLEQLIKSRFIELFGDPIKNTQHRPTTAFVNVVTMQRGFDLPVQDRKQSGNIPVYGSNGVLDHHNQAKVCNGGVITGRSGTIGKVFYTTGAYWPLNTTLFSVDTHENNIIYLAHLVRMFNLDRFTEGTGVPTLNRNKFHSAPIIDVPIDEQNQFAAFVEQTDKSKYYSSLSFRYCQAAANTYRQEWMTCRTSDF